jgi:hypothetical protein
MTSRTFWPVACVLTVSVVSLSVVSASSSAVPAIVPAESAAQLAQTDPLFLANDLPRLPAGVVRAVRPLSVMRATYEFAARHPEVMNFVPCFCGCERGGHKDNHDCFVSGRDAKKRVTGWEVHAVECLVCVDVAYQAFQMHGSGASVSAIRDAVEKKYASHQGGHTPTPMPPKRGGKSPD